ncbi:ABC transporter permease [Sphingomonas sp. H39-1-10]|uniref:ABC transporter permease n=1 Tax=Sphingomonas pollutisoli TaxID=3030829 RepID=UPI0023BA3D0D|nr:ABC transporter permease [Sphingomonas pollutisoli]MDF0491445.1 ABC transporter permease [Sphingomonas pollutisoli]
MAGAMGRLRAMIVKEFWAILRDPRARTVLFLPPLVQLFVFSFASTLEVKNFDVGLLDRSGGRAAIELASQLAGSPNVHSIVPLHSMQELRAAINDRKVIAAIVLQPDFDMTIARGGTATAGVILDGRRSNAAQIVAGYLQRIATATGTVLRPDIPSPPARSVVTNWFNPNLDYLWFTLPGLIVTIGAVSGISVTAQSVARERELGTFDQLMVSPLRVPEILVGKMVPPVVVGLVNGSIYLLVGHLLLGVPFTGSVLLFYLSLFMFLCALTGVGMFVSAASATQQQAFLGAFLVVVPLILLSGYASPVDNTPGWLQIVSLANPARWFLEIDEGLFLKAMPAGDVFARILPLMLIAAVTLGLGAWLFRARME